MSEQLIPKIMASGRIVDLCNLTAKDVNVWDIAWALHNLNRYTGACPTPWSVLNHTMLCETLAKEYIGKANQGSACDQIELRDATRRMILIHDAAEAYVGDMTKWMKERADVPGFLNIEKCVEKVLCQVFHLTMAHEGAAVDTELVKFVDGQAYDLEMRTIWPGVETAWPKDQRTTLKEDALEDRNCPLYWVDALRRVCPQEVRDNVNLWAVPYSLKGIDMEKKR